MADGWRRFLDLFSAHPGSAKAERYGRFAVPGDAVLDLPSGTARIYYDEAIGGDNDEGFDAPDDLQVELAPAAGGPPLPIRFKSPSQTSSSQKRTMSRAYLGRVDIPTAGRYRVTVRAAQQPPNDPHVSVG